MSSVDQDIVSSPVVLVDVAGADRLAEAPEYPSLLQNSDRMAGNGVPVLLITANVGSIFEEVRLTFHA